MKAIVFLASLFVAAVAVPRSHNGDEYCTTTTTHVTYSEISSPITTVTADNVQTSAPPTEAASSAATASTCNPYATVTANFDTLPTGLPPMANYSGVVWNGFTVMLAPSMGVPIEAASAANVIDANPVGSNIMQAPGSTNMLFSIASFDFACSANMRSNTALPAPCSLLVISEPFTHVADIQSFGPYVSAPFYDGQVVENMTHVDLDGAYGSRFSFSLVAGSGLSQLYLDNVVIVQYGSTCPDSEN